jgi:hypothetical protein
LWVTPQHSAGTKTAWWGAFEKEDGTSSALTKEQVLALAPDAGAAKAAQPLATPRKWVTAGQDERAIWGECAGSGALPYQVAVDLAETAYRCTCPSRKVPCKHVLGLLLLRASAHAAVKEASRPAWVEEWISKRDARAEQRAARPAGQPKPVNAEAAAATRERREERIAAGLQGLARWLEDLIRQGLATAHTRPYGYWEEAAARLVDAQAPSAARLVRQLSWIPASGPGWPERLLEAAARLHLLITGYQRVGPVPESVADDLRTAVGWTMRQEEVLAREAVHDRWCVLGRRAEGEERLRFQRTWLWGEASGRVALLLEFAHGSQPFETTIPAGGWLEGDVVFYPGSAPLRAILREGFRAAEPSPRIPGHDTITGALDAFTGALAANPWLELYPVALHRVVPSRNENTWVVRDGADRVLPLQPSAEPLVWVLLAVSGGHAVDVVGEWDGQRLYPLSVVGDGRFLPLDAAALEGAA